MDVYRLFVFIGLVLLMSMGSSNINAYATSVVNVPIVIETQDSENRGVDTIVMSWDQKSDPDPVLLQWRTSQVTVRGAALEPLTKAFEYALVSHSTEIRPTGTLSLSTTIFAPLTDEGISAGAALAVGFLALLRGDQLSREIVITGSLESTGRIGQVRNIAKKIRAAARQGYRVILVPRGQMHIPPVRLVGIGLEPNVIVREVGTVKEAYEIMTGKRR